MVKLRSGVPPMTHGMPIYDKKIFEMKPNDVIVALVTSLWLKMVATLMSALALATTSAESGQRPSGEGPGTPKAYTRPVVHE